MRVCLVALLAVGAVWCGWSEDEYFTKRAEAECEQLFACSDSLVDLSGWSSEEECVDASNGRAAYLKGDALGCTGFESKQAKQCVKGYDDYACREPGQDLFVPEACESVFTSCDDGGGDTDG